MRSIGFGITLAVVALAAESCIKEGLSDDCNGRVVIAVRDTNYDNAAEVGDAVLADNLPMRDYIATLVTWDHPRGTDAYTPFEEPLSDTQLTHPVSPQHLSRGVNELSAVGRGFTAAMLYSAAESSRVLTLHPGGQEGEDIYLGGDAVEYPRMDDRTVWMMRTKGKLMVDVVGVPDAVRQVELSVGGLYATVSEELSSAKYARAADTDASRLLYGGTASVSRLYPSAGTTALYDLKLAPSAAATSPLTIAFIDADGNTLYSLGADITIARNHITRLKAEYAVDRSVWTITVNVDGEWLEIKHMVLSDQD